MPGVGWLQFSLKDDPIQQHRIPCLPITDTNDHEVKIFVDGEPFIAKHWPDMMGMDPDDLLSYREFVPRDQAHESTVVRCGCGIVGCGSAWVRISAQGDRVTWDSWQGDTGKPPAPTLVFARDQYMQAVKPSKTTVGRRLTEPPREFLVRLSTIPYWRLTISNINGLLVASAMQL